MQFDHTRKALSTLKVIGKNQATDHTQEPVIFLICDSFFRVSQRLIIVKQKI